MREEEKWEGVSPSLVYQEIRRNIVAGSRPDRAPGENENDVGAFCT